MKPNLIISFLFLFFIASCSYQEGYKSITEKGQFNIEVAGYLTKTRDLSTEPSLQYHNRFRTVYLLVDDKLKSKDKESFTVFHDNILKGFKKTFGEVKVKTLPDTILNGKKAIIQELSLKTDGEKVFYILACVETDKFYYQLCSWTLDFRRDKYEKDLRHMIYSFKEL